LGEKMKKDLLKTKFIELRATGYTLENICDRLKITKPTAVKWGKLFSEDIGLTKKHLIANIFAEQIIEHEQGILFKLEQFRRKRNMNISNKLSDKIDKKLFKGLEKVFKKKIMAIHIKANDEYVKSALFIFDDDIKVEERN
jgi:hypothetical protein